MAYDIFHQQNQLKLHVQDFCLNPSSWKKYSSSYNFDWKSVRFVKSSKNSIPEESGIYAFFVRPGIANFKDNSYLMYIGKAGDNNDNNLRKRFMQYIYGKKSDDRPKLKWFFKTWNKYIYFCYSEVTSDQVSLKDLEEKLNDAFIPPYNENDFSVEVRKIVKVLR